MPKTFVTEEDARAYLATALYDMAALFGVVGYDAIDAISDVADLVTLTPGLVAA